MSYYPSLAPNPLTSQWMQQELRRLAESLEQGQLVLTLLGNSTAPAKSKEGEIRIADGVNWDPGSGPGTYVYRQGEWMLIEAGGNSILNSMMFFLGE